jgi:hypothetical protein
MAGHSRHGEWSGRCVNGRQSGPRRGLAGTYSVRAHTDLRQLLADALLYDVLVFPCPEDAADYIRWEAEGWDPELLALRITQLGDAAVTIPWDRQLRNIWAYKFKQLTEEQRQDPNIAYDLTSWQLSAHSVLTLMGQDDDRAMAVAQDPPQIHPRCRAGRSTTRSIRATRTRRGIPTAMGSRLLRGRLRHSRRRRAETGYLRRRGTAAPSPCGAGRRRRDDVSPHPRHHRRRGLPAREAADVVMGGRPSRTT